MKTRHKHADLIHAWAEGATVQVRLSTGEWVDQDPIKFPNGYEARIKPEKKPDDDAYIGIYIEEYGGRRKVSDLFEGAEWVPPEKSGIIRTAIIKLTQSGETGKLIKAEVL